jgi:hypothetical protein
VISQLPVDEQLDAFQDVLSRNEVLTEVLSRSASLGLPGRYLTAGCLFQTVWSAVTSRAPGDGIKDYDLSGRDMLAALIAGQRDPHTFAALARGTMRAKTSVLQEALTGHFTEHHAF